MKNGNRILIGLAVGVGSVATICLCALMAIGLLLETGYIPDTKVLKGSELTKRDRQTLVDLNVLNPDEEILYFYSAGMLSIAEDGSFFTPERVVCYENYEGEFSVSQAKYSEIVSIKIESKGSYLEDCMLLIETSVDEDDFYLLVSTEDGRDKLFIEELRQRWRDSRQAAPTE